MVEVPSSGNSNNLYTGISIQSCTSINVQTDSFLSFDIFYETDFYDIWTVSAHKPYLSCVTGQYYKEENSSTLMFKRFSEINFLSRTENGRRALESRGVYCFKLS